MTWRYESKVDTGTAQQVKHNQRWSSVNDESDAATEEWMNRKSCVVVTSFWRPSLDHVNANHYLPLIGLRFWSYQDHRVQCWYLRCSSLPTSLLLPSQTIGQPDLVHNINYLYMTKDLMSVLPVHNYYDDLCLKFRDSMKTVLITDLSWWTLA